MKVNSCRLFRHKNGHKFETRSDRTRVRMNFLHRFLVHSQHVKLYPVYDIERKKNETVPVTRFIKQI